MPAMEITTRVGCKNLCAYCPQDKFIKQYSRRSSHYCMTFDQFRFYIEKIPTDVTIDFAGMSEPWLNPECTKMLNYVATKGHRVRVYTTLVGMTNSDLEILAKHVFDTFVVHLPSVEGYERIGVDEHYLDLLESVTKSITKASFICHGQHVDARIRKILEKNGKRHCPAPPITRAGNVAGSSCPVHLRGVVACYRDLQYNVLLPNGDVLLCCMDYGLEHVLGNMNHSDYPSLFRGREFTRIKKGLWNGSSGILCRRCDMFAYDVADHYLKILKGSHSLADFRGLMQRGISRLGRALHSRRDG